MKAYTAKLVYHVRNCWISQYILGWPVTDANAKDLKLAHFMLPMHDLQKNMFD